MKTKLLPIFLILVFCSLPVSAQVKTNFEIINSLVEKSVEQADSLLNSKKEIFLSIETSSSLNVLKPTIYNSFAKKGYVLRAVSDSAVNSIDYTIISAKVNYKNSFSDGIFGGTLIGREIQLGTSAVIKSENKTIRPFQFYETYSDTVKLNDITSIEDQTFPFTHAQLPSLPLLSNLWEPIIAIGTLTVTVILLFTVRSK